MLPLDWSCTSGYQYWFKIKSGQQQLDFEISVETKFGITSMSGKKIVECAWNSWREWKNTWSQQVWT